MPIQHIHTYLVHPGKNVDTPEEIAGATLPHKGQLFDVLEGVYSTSKADSNVEISFNNDTDGKQHNQCRDLLLKYLSGPTQLRGHDLALKLQNATDRRSGLGLFFLMSGEENGKKRLVFSRFPTKEAISAELSGGALNIEFLEKVFMRNASAYKAAIYEDSSLKTGFWTGRAVDKQSAGHATKVSNYWIEDFLDSDLRVTSAEGTRQLGVALKAAIKNAPTIAMKTELAAAATLAHSMAGARTSIRDFADKFGLSPDAFQMIETQLRFPELANVPFKFDSNEFRAHVTYRSVELDNGGVLTADTESFDDVFQQQVVNKKDGVYRFSTSGKVVQEKVGKSPGGKQ